MEGVWTCCTRLVLHLTTVSYVYTPDLVSASLVSASDHEFEDNDDTDGEHGDDDNDG